MKQVTYQMKPQDIVILLKIVTQNNKNWQQIPLAESLKISQSEISQSIARSKYAGLLYDDGRQVMSLALIDFLQYGISYVFPQKPGAITRGMPTAHSALPLNKEIISDEFYVWPTAYGTVRGQSIIPLYPSVPEAAKVDSQLYELLAIVDTLRIGRVREKNIAIEELKKRIK